MTHTAANNAYSRIERLIKALGLTTFNEFSNILGFNRSDLFDNMKVTGSGEMGAAIEMAILNKYPNISRAYLRGTSENIFRDENMTDQQVIEDYRRRIQNVIAILENSVGDDATLDTVKSLVWSEFESLHNEIIQLQIDVKNLRATVDKKDTDIKKLLAFAEKYSK